MKTFLETLPAMRTRALRTHHSVARWLVAAGVSPSTYYRWKIGRNSPTERSIARLDAASRGIQIVTRPMAPDTTAP